MLNSIARNGVARTQLVAQGTKTLYKTVIKAAVCGIVAVGVMWLINVAGFQGVNFIFLFAGVAVTTIWAFSPTRLLIAMGAGALVQGLRDEDITKGSVEGLKVWYQVVLGVMLWICIVASVLAVIPFKSSPFSFWLMAAMALLVTLAYASVKSVMLKRIIVGFALAVTAYYAWPLVPTEWKAAATTEQPGKVGSGSAVLLPPVTQGTARWGTVAEDGTLPVGVWSESYKIPIGYRTSYDAGNCVVYKVRYQNYGGGWVEHACKGAYPPADEIQFMMLKAGVKKIPFSVEN